MECIYSTNLQKDSEFLEITGAEAKHIHVLRLNIGDEIEISNGNGLIANSVIQSINAKVYSCRIQKIHHLRGELKFRLDVAFGLLNDRSRLEFLIEKATELGVSNLYPIITQFTQKKAINSKRLEQKALAAMKQSKRAILPSVIKASKFSCFITSLKNYDNIILTDIDGSSIDNISIKGNTIVLVGPEGGFSNEEISELKKLNPNLLSLGSRRLRTETAAILSLGLISLKM